MPANKLPKPADAPKNKVAVLPPTPKVKEAAAAADRSPTAKTAKPKPARGTYTVATATRCRASPGRHGVSVAALKEANGLRTACASARR